jgi:hypothetical protein
MTRYALIQSGVIAAVVEQGSAPTIGGEWVEVTGAFGPGDTYVAGVFGKAPDARPRHITRRAFWNRFPDANETALRAVILGASPVVLAGALARLQARVDSSPYVDLDLPETQGGIAWLASADVPETVTLDGQVLPLRLTAQQAAAILDAPVPDSERP